MVLALLGEARFGVQQMHMDGLLPGVSSPLKKHHPAPLHPHFQARLPCTESTFTMPGYNSVFDFDVPVGVYDMPDPLGDEPALTMDQSGTWNAALQGSTGLMEGGTAAQLHAQLDFAPSQGARSNG